MTLIVTAPGKVILFGEHAVCFGKKAIATAIDKKTTVEIICQPGCAYVSLNLIDLDYHFKWSLGTLSQLDKAIEAAVEIDDNGDKIICYNDNIDKFLHEIACAGISSVRDVNSQTVKAQGQNGKIDSAIASSKSFLFLYFSISICYQEKDKRLPIDVKISSNIPIGAGLGSSSAFSVSLSGALLRCILGYKPEDEKINKWAFQSERQFHGKPSGIDNNISNAGGTIIFKDNNIWKATNMRSTKIVLVDTKVKRNTKDLVNRTIARRQMFPEIINNIMDAIGDISDKAWEYLNGNDSYDFKTMVEMNQYLLNCLGAGHLVIDDVLSIAKKRGFQGKLTGAGGGGCVVIFVEGYSDESVNDLLDDLNSSQFRAEKIHINCSGISFQ